VLNVPATRVKLDVVLVAKTVIEGGTGNIGLLLVSVTVAPPCGAERFNITEQLLLEPATRLAGTQFRDITFGGDIRDTDEDTVVPP
jgi:hypothetical protein